MTSIKTALITFSLTCNGRSPTARASLRNDRPLANKDPRSNICYVFVQLARCLIIQRSLRGFGAPPEPERDEDEQRCGFPPQAGSRTVPHCCVTTLLCITAKMIVKWQSWVRLGHSAMSAARPFLHRKRKSIRDFAMSQCQQPTSRSPGRDPGTAGRPNRHMG
jgi:hypothetical protein